MNTNTPPNPVVKTAISLQAPLFEQAESLARELHISRSKMFSLAVEEFIRRHQSQQMLAQLNEVYGGEDVPTAEEKMILKLALKTHRRIAEGE